jgi:hypothetical protein
MPGGVDIHVSIIENKPEAPLRTCAISFFSHKANYGPWHRDIHIPHTLDTGPGWQMSLRICHIELHRGILIAYVWKCHKKNKCKSVTTNSFNSQSAIFIRDARLDVCCAGLIITLLLCY